MRRWSSLKARVEAFLAPSLAGRVELRITGYRWNHDREGRAWITVDGVEVYSFCTFRRWREFGKLQSELNELAPRESSADPYAVNPTVEGLLDDRGVLSREQFTRALASYCDISVEDALESGQLVHRALAVLDRRLGKRRLEGIQLSAVEHPLVRQLLAVRRGAEFGRNVS